ncbi:hypothetical protein Hanom_Chr12g01179881 [Helianthus anomalus]
MTSPCYYYFSIFIITDHPKLKLKKVQKPSRNFTIFPAEQKAGTDTPHEYHDNHHVLSFFQLYPSPFNIFT